jgi:hypothetical protein
MIPERTKLALRRQKASKEDAEEEAPEASEKDPLGAQTEIVPARQRAAG